MGLSVSEIEKKVELFKARKEKLKQEYASLLSKKKSYANNYTQANAEKFENKIRNILSFINGNLFHYENEKILDYLEDNLKLINKNVNQETIKDAILFFVEEASDFVDRYLKVQELFQTYTVNTLENAILDVSNELINFRRLRSIADNALTENIYDAAVKKYKKLEESYRSYFYWGISLLLLISICMFLMKTTLVPTLVSSIEFWVIKISVIVVGITLISYFLKQSSHYQRLADQNYQTQVELQAYPSFMESIPTEEAASVRKELALKYFGREIDGAAHKDMSNLISDQMKSTTDMVKATTEAIKNLKGGN